MEPVLAQARERKQPEPGAGKAVLARILTAHEVGEVAETYLMGHGQ